MFAAIFSVVDLTYAYVQEEVGYQPISEKETSDLKALMSGCDTAISAADEFADRSNLNIYLKLINPLHINSDFIFDVKVTIY